MINLLQAAAPAAQGQSWTMWVMLILIFAIMWFFMIRPQRKQQKELQKFREGLKAGDKVVTNGGIFGTIVDVAKESGYAILEVDKNVKIRVVLNALNRDFSDTKQQ